MEDNMAVKAFGKYEVIEKIGEGGFGQVFKGRDPHLNRIVAIKTCTSADADLRQRFLREAEIAGLLLHPNITTVYAFDIEDGTPYLVQEYLNGEDLDHKIKRCDPLPEATKIGYLLQVAEGLHYAHSQDVVHRDIKPANIRVLENGQVRIMDFGIAKLMTADLQLTQTGMTLGTAGYLPPEQLRGEAVDLRADLFSFGILAYELMTYARPFAGANLSAILYAIAHQDPLPVTDHWPACPPPLGTMIETCLRKDPAERYGSLEEVLAILRPLVQGTDVPGAASAAIPALAPPPPPPPLPPAVPEGVSKISVSVPSGAVPPLPPTRVEVDPLAKTVAHGPPGDVPKPPPATAGRRSSKVLPVALAVAFFAALGILGLLWTLGGTEPEDPPEIPQEEAEPPVTSTSEETLEVEGSALPDQEVTEADPETPEADPEATDTAPNSTAESGQTEPATNWRPIKPKPKPTVSTPPPPLTPEPTAELPRTEIKPPPPPETPPFQWTLEGPRGYSMGHLALGQKAYADRDFVFARVPEQYRDLPAIQTLNDDKKAEDISISFSVNQAVDVFVAHDIRLRKKPDWMDFFTSTGERLAIDEGGEQVVYEVFSREYPAGTVTLGANARARLRGKQKSSMYLVFLRPR